MLVSVRSKADGKCPSAESVSLAACGTPGLGFSWMFFYCLGVIVAKLAVHRCVFRGWCGGCVARPLARRRAVGQLTPVCLHRCVVHSDLVQCVHLGVRDADKL